MWTFDATLLLPRSCLSFTRVAGSQAAPKRPTRSYCRKGLPQASALVREDTSAEIVIPTCFISSLERGLVRCPVAMPSSTRAGN